MEQALFHQMADIQASHWWYEARRKIIESFIQRLNLKSGATILEVGCGTGVNLLMLKKYGETCAVEPNDFARTTAQKLSGCDIREGYLPHDIPFPGPFDLIGAFDVIEHIDDDRGSVAALRTLLKENGHALFTVPAFPFLWSRHDEANHHKRRYRRDEFRRLLENAGYKIEYISYYNTLLFPLVAAVRLAKKSLKLNDSPDESMPRIPFVNAALCAIFAAERYLLKCVSLPFGVSIIALCRKQ